MQRLRLLVGLTSVIVVAVALAACGQTAVTPTPAPTATPVPTGATPSPGDQPTATPVPGRDLEAYFRGKTITINVGSAPGGGHDVNSRLWALHGSKHIPGQPRMIVRNLAGGGGQRALIATFTSEPDGFTMANLHPRWPTSALLGEDTGIPNFDLETLIIVGSPVNVPVPRLICSRTDVATVWDDVFTLDRPLTFGTSVRGGTSLRPIELLDIVWGNESPFRVIDGYGGIAEQMAAFDRGELSGLSTCSERDVPRLYPEWIGQDLFRPLFWWDAPSDPVYLADLGLTPEQVPYFFDLPRIELTDEQLTAFEAANALGRYTRAIVLPPGVPDDVVQALQEAYRRTMEDPEFVASMHAAGYDVGYGDPQDFRQTMDAARNLSPEGKDLLRQIAGE